MAKAFLTNINLKGNQLLNAVIHTGTSAPSALAMGQIYYNTTDKLIYAYNGTSFIPVNGGVVVGASTFYGVTTFAGTANQIVATPTGSSPNGTVTFSLPSTLILPASGTIGFPGATSGTITVQATSVAGTNTLTLPAATDTLVGKNTTDTLTNKTLTSPTINGGTATGLTGLAIRSTGTGAFDVTLANTENLTAGRTLTLKLNDAARTIDLSGNLTLGGALTTASSFTTSGANALTLTTTGTTNATLPSGTVTLVDLASSQALTNKTISGLTVSTTTGTLTIPAATIAFSGANNVTLTSTGATTLTLPTTGTLATLAGSEALTNKSVNGLTLTSNATGWTISGGTTAVGVTFNGGTAYTISGTNGQTYTLPSNGGTLVNTGVTTLSSLASVGTITTGVWNGSNIPLGNGGTNAALTATAGGIVYSTASAMAITAAGTSGYLLTSGGSGAPTWTQASSSNVNSAVVQRDSSGNIAVTQVTVSADPTQALQVATKQYVDNIKAGFNLHDAVEAATTTDLTTLGTWGTVTYTAGTTGADGGTGVGATLTPANNGALVIDNYTPDTNDRILVKNQSTQTQNGIYVVTATGSAGAKWTLTRATDSDNNVLGLINAGDLVYVAANPAEYTTPIPTNLNTSWVMNAQGTATGQSIKIGTDNITYAQFTGSGTVTAGNGISVTGNQVAVALGSAFDNTTGTGTSGLSLSNGTLQIRLNSAGGLTSTTAGLAINAGTGFNTTGNTLNFASGYGVRKYATSITGDNTSTSFTLTHGLGTRDVQVRVYQTSAAPDTQYADVEVDITRSSANTNDITIAFATAPASTTTYGVVVVG